MHVHCMESITVSKTTSMPIGTYIKGSHTTRVRGRLAFVSSRIINKNSHSSKPKTGAAVAWSN